MANEKKYIELEKALAICENEYQQRLKMFDYCGDTVAWNIGNAIKKLPAADVLEVRRGHWIPISDGEMPECSECGECYDTEPGTFREFCWCYKYCPNCGARMDGGKNETD